MRKTFLKKAFCSILFLATAMGYSQEAGSIGTLLRNEAKASDINSVRIQVDVQGVRTHKELPAFISTRGGVSLRPGDGVIHSWLNRLLLPDTVGTGGDSHTRFPIGISFPAGSGLFAFAAATGVMPLDMPESVLVRFSGKQIGRAHV